MDERAKRASLSARLGELSQARALLEGVVLGGLLSDGVDEPWMWAATEAYDAVGRAVHEFERLHIESLKGAIRVSDDEQVD